ncbi:MAG: RnfABCDGE type electron transport complex subunit B [Rhodothermales bacterium]|nr:RnfABCDGE type electron transport complex subunit B [Rhodothermales bacterium]
MDALIAVGFLAGLSVLLAIVLAVAHRKLWVYEDPRIDTVTDMLPGANCGACGLPGCRAFAEKVVEGDIQPSDCPVGGPDSARFVANFLGIDAGTAEKKVARLLCAGGRDVALQVGEYEGFSSCRAAATIGGGFKGCTFGCLGLADCEVSCTFDAITMADNGLPVVDLELCTACGDCVRACPKDLFVIEPVSHCLVVQCKSILEGEAALAQCKVACTGCGICAADAPVGLISMEHNLPVINDENIGLLTPIATLRCPTGAIKWIPGQQFAELSTTKTKSPTA